MSLITVVFRADTPHHHRTPLTRHSLAPCSSTPTRTILVHVTQSSSQKHVYGLTFTPLLVIYILYIELLYVLLTTSSSNTSDLLRSCVGVHRLLGSYPPKRRETCVRAVGLSVGVDHHTFSPASFLYATTAACWAEGAEASHGLWGWLPGRSEHVCPALYQNSKRFTWQQTGKPTAEHLPGFSQSIRQS